MQHCSISATVSTVG